MTITANAPARRGAHAATPRPTHLRARFASDASDAFFADVRRRVALHLRQTGHGRYDDGRIALKGAVYGTITLGAYLVALWGGLPPWGSFAAGLVFGLGCLMLGLNVGHDGAHNCLTRHRWLNLTLQTVIFTLIGADAYLWRLRHVKSHHVFPNVNDCDIDIDDYWWIRLSPNQPHLPHHRFQHLYAPLIFWLTNIHTTFYQDAVYLFKRDLANMRDIRHPWYAYPLFIASKVGYFAIWLGIPMAVLPYPWWWIALAWPAISFVMSVAFIALLIGTHFAEETVFPVVDESGVIPLGWAWHALATSLDWNPESRLANAIAGGANAHAAHHLFPNVAHVHYPEITRIIREEAARHSMPYNVTSFAGMLRSHYRFLRRLGQGSTAG
ncbi:fatty acid desaturase [Limibaculum sp. FT325]|uniref:fatty acid desaturase family protein n=1 Tax=Thermohalobaculum sediminis TaxID=2939436 RepID=UPI0020BF9A78|nr:fatty acid desaturase [Limibaculum sediminis]MCL5775428.1 fatty acid desaturase [Limibaculum sediminis]